MERKFTVLRVVATIFKVLALLLLVLGVLGACGFLAVGAIPSLAGLRNATGLSGGGAIGGVLAGIGVLFFALLYFLLLFAFGELISLLIALEENTRVTAERLLARPLEETTSGTLDAPRRPARTAPLPPPPGPPPAVTP